MQQENWNVLVRGKGPRTNHLNDLSHGGFKFQVQRVKEGAVAQRLPRAWQS